MQKYTRIWTAVSIATLSIASSIADTPSQWDFNNSAAGLASSFGPGVTQFWDRDPNFPSTAAATSFGTCSGLGIGLINGVDAGVVRIPAYNGEQGLIVHHGTPSHGGVYGNQYTLIYDIYIANADYTGGSGWLPFQNTNCCNDNDADAYIQMGVGIGINGEYAGTVNPDTWHRIAFVYDLTLAGDNHWKYIDGVLAAPQQLDGGAGLDGRFALYTTNDADPNHPEYDSFHMFTEGDTSGQYTTQCYVNSMYFSDRPLSAAEIAALGTADADGIAGGPAPCPGDFNGDHQVSLSDLAILLAHFGTQSGASPGDGDMDVDGDVDLNDLSALLSRFGSTC